MNDLFLQALKGENKEKRPPIWLMRQAGRYMASYQKLRAKHSFLGLCKTPELIAQVTQLPITEFGFDAAIVFSDILLIAEAMGLQLHFEEGKGPILAPCLKDKHSLKNLSGKQIVLELSFVIEGIKLLKRGKNLKVPLIGFAGAPFTVASYMIEGESNRELLKTKEWLFRDPDSFHELLDLIADYTIEYVNAQIDAGVDAIQLFDSWAHVLAARQFEEFSLRYMKKIISKMKKCPVTLFCRGSSIFYERLASIKPDCISLDWQSDVKTIRKKIAGISLQGNLDPDILLQDTKTVEKEAKAMLEAMKDDPGYIFNLGHGILPKTPIANVHALVACIKRG